MDFSHSQFLRVVGGHKDGGLTGRRRYRKVFNPGFSKSGERGEDRLVLQVEESVWNDAYEGKLGRWVCEWRDATPNDVNKEELV